MGSGSRLLAVCFYDNENAVPNSNRYSLLRPQTLEKEAESLEEKMCAEGSRVESMTEEMWTTRDTSIGRSRYETESPARYEMCDRERRDTRNTHGTGRSIRWMISRIRTSSLR